ncbi:MAG: acireductone synthase [Woeseiaceae bacterium]
MTAAKAIVTDIEGTTSSIAFVHEVLFPYAARALPDFLRSHQSDPQVAERLEEVRSEIGEPEAELERLIEVLQQWIREDRKATALKSLQGCVWEEGYRSGAFTGHVYDDTVPNLRKWHERGILLYVYSSGSVKAQQLLFGHSDAGDLQPLFTGYFDTRVGGKRDAASYRTICERIGLPAWEILFLSDVTEELDAAAAAGMQTVQLVRDWGITNGRHTVAHDFGDILL